MSTIQPGDGYTFSASSSGVTLDVNKPWTPPLGDGLYLGVTFPEFPDPPLPPIPELPSFFNPLGARLKPLQFQCSLMSLPVSGTPTAVLQVGMGSVTYTQSLMPLIKTGPFTDHRQAYINFAAVISPSVTPVVLGDATSPYMLGGGGYALTGTGRWYVTMTKWDVSSGAALGPLLNLEMPWVSIVKEESPEFDVLFVDSGPSLYQNTMNIQKMDGYEEVIPDGEVLLDWGHCHTTYFNPRFLGHHVRILAVIDSVPATPCVVTVVELRAGSATVNEIQQIIFTGIYKSGTVTFSYSSVTTTTSFNPSTQSAFELQECLNTIPALTGNVLVQSSGPGAFQVEFTNGLKHTDVPTLISNSSLTAFTTWFTVYECAVGSQDIVIPCELNATSLMNKPDLTEAEDPYYLNANSIPPWDKINNIEDARAASLLDFVPAFFTPVINETVPRDFDKIPLVYAEEGGCSDENTCSPFKVRRNGTGETSTIWEICPGSVNGRMPDPAFNTFEMADGFVWLKLWYDGVEFPKNAPNGITAENGAVVPADTDTYGYIPIAQIIGDEVTQLVTGSLFADRIKLGSLTARYYYSRV